MQNVKRAIWTVARSDVDLSFWLGDPIADVASKVHLERDGESTGDFRVVTEHVAWKITVDSQDRVSAIAFRETLPHLICFESSIWDLGYQDLCVTLDRSLTRNQGTSSSGDLMKVMFRENYAAVVVITRAQTSTG